MINRINTSSVIHRIVAIIIVAMLALVLLLSSPSLSMAHANHHHKQHHKQHHKHHRNQNTRNYCPVGVVNQDAGGGSKGPAALPFDHQYGEGGADCNLANVRIGR